MHTTLLRSYRVDEWSTWFQAAELKVPLLTGHVFDSSLALADAAAQGAGVALLPVRLFGRDLLGGRLVTLFDVEVETGSYWLTKLTARRETDGMKAFRGWTEQACREG